MRQFTNRIKKSKYPILFKNKTRQWAPKNLFKTYIENTGFL